VGSFLTADRHKIGHSAPLWGMLWGMFTPILIFYAISFQFTSQYKMDRQTSRTYNAAY